MPPVSKWRSGVFACEHHDGREERQQEIPRVRGVPGIDGEPLRRLLPLSGAAGRERHLWPEGAFAALPLTVLVGVGFSHFFPISLVLSFATAVLVSAAVTLVVLAATWLPTRSAVAVEPRDALWRE
ncbi:MAG: ABC transporter permease [Gemmatimonadales bacterium]